MLKKPGKVNSCQLDLAQLVDRTQHEPQRIPRPGPHSAPSSFSATLAAAFVSIATSSPVRAQQSSAPPVSRDTLPLLVIVAAALGRAVVADDGDRAA